jgi:hypothetical protein
LHLVDRGGRRRRKKNINGIYAHTTYYYWIGKSADTFVCLAMPCFYHFFVMAFMAFMSCIKCDIVSPTINNIIPLLLFCCNLSFQVV